MIKETANELSEMDHQDIEASNVEADEVRQENESEVHPEQTIVHISNRDHKVDVLDEKMRSSKCKSKKSKNKRSDDKSLFRSDIYVYISGPSPDDYDSDPLDYEPGERSTFIIVVLSLVLLMIFLTIGAVLLALYVPRLNELVLRYSIILVIVGAISSIAAYYGMACYAYGRILPCNIIFLVIGTFGMTLLVAVTAATVAPHILLIALGITAIIILICIGLAFTSIDFTGFLFLAVVAILGLVLSSLIVSLLYFVLNIRLRIVELILAFLLPIAYSFMLIIELQMVLGGRQFEYGEDDYAFAAYSLYTSFVVLFLRIIYLLTLLQEFFD